MMSSCRQFGGFTAELPLTRLKGRVARSPQTVRKTLNDLVRLGFLVSDSPKTPVRLAFPLDYRERLFPNLFTDAPVA